MMEHFEPQYCRQFASNLAIQVEKIWTIQHVFSECHEHHTHKGVVLLFQRWLNQSHKPNVGFDHAGPSCHLLRT